MQCSTVQREITQSLILKGRAISVHLIKSNCRIVCAVRFNSSVALTLVISVLCSSYVPYQIRSFIVIKPGEDMDRDVARLHTNLGSSTTCLDWMLRHSFNFIFHCVCANYTGAQ